MQISAEQGQFLALLVTLLGARRVLEIGTFTGYSALVMALALPSDGQLVTLDMNRQTTDLARQFWNRAGVSERIESRLGPALTSLEGLEGPFDLAFIDADKTNYDAYYERALDLLRPGGVVVVDNVLWGGQVLDPQYQDADTVAIRELNQKLHHDSRVELSMLPLADGITLAVKKRSGPEQMQRDQPNSGL